MCTNLNLEKVISTLQVEIIELQLERAATIYEENDRYEYDYRNGENNLNTMQNTNTA